QRRIRLRRGRTRCRTAGEHRRRRLDDEPPRRRYAPGRWFRSARTRCRRPDRLRSPVHRGVAVNALAYRADPRHGLTVGAQRRPEPGPHQVVVRVRAASLNRRDLMLLDSTYPLPLTPDTIPLCDGVGEVIALGEGVTRAALGDRVTASYF